MALRAAKGILTLAAALALGSAAAQPPRLLFEAGESSGFRPGVPVEVRSGLLQVTAGTQLALSAPAGARFLVQSLGEDGAAHLVIVYAGSITAIGLASPAWSVLETGTYLLAAPLEPCRDASRGCEAFRAQRVSGAPEQGAELDAPRLPDLDYPLSAQFVNAILLRQADALKVDTRALLQGIFLPFRRGSR